MADAPGLWWVVFTLMRRPIGLAGVVVSSLLAEIRAEIAARVAATFAVRGVGEEVLFTSPANADFGDLALPCHRFARALRKAPQSIASELIAVVKQIGVVADASAVAGYLNISLDWGRLAGRVCAWATMDSGAHGRSVLLAGQHQLIEFSAPNTNKPQHLGHCRNNILGAALGNLLEAAGAKVTRVNLINDRGVHICKSMLAWQRWGEGVTPASTGRKGDHLVGDFYVRFSSELKAEYKARYPNGGGPEEEVFFNTESELGAATRAMLMAWEAGDPEVLGLWRTMNSWCEVGFDATYTRMGVHFDLVQRESETYAFGKDLVARGLTEGVFHCTIDGAVAFDLVRVGMEGEKIVLRADGTSIYITQDLGTAVARDEGLGPDRLIYVVGNEQDHYFAVLFKILGVIRPAMNGRLVHRSYGMVELPDGKMKSREGAVVDADNLMDELHEVVRAANVERWGALSAAEQARRAEAIAQAGLRYFLLKSSPARTIIFDKRASISMEGDTGPYCQYAYARCTAILAKVGDGLDEVEPDWAVLAEGHARRLLTALLALPDQHHKAVLELDPSLVAKALYDLARAFSSFYAAPEGRVVGAAPGVAAARAALVRATQAALGASMQLLGVTLLDEM